MSCDCPSLSQPALLSCGLACVYVSVSLSLSLSLTLSPCGLTDVQVKCAGKSAPPPCLPVDCFHPCLPPLLLVPCYWDMWSRLFEGTNSIFHLPFPSSPSLLFLFSSFPILWSSYVSLLCSTSLLLSLSSSFCFLPLLLLFFSLFVCLFLKSG